MILAHINRIGTAHPPHDVHHPFLQFMTQGAAGGEGASGVRADGATFRHRSTVIPCCIRMAWWRLTRRSRVFPARRLSGHRRAHAGLRRARAGPGRAGGAALDLQGRAQDITHLIVASCTGFVAPGLDQLLARRLGLRPDLQRSCDRLHGLFRRRARLAHRPGDRAGRPDSPRAGGESRALHPAFAGDR